jgi:uncharacterized protein
MVFRWICAILIFIVSTRAGAAENQSDKKRDIEKLLALTGVSVASQQMADASMTDMVEAFKKTTPGLSPRAFDVMKEEARKVMFLGFPELATRIAWIYDNLYTHEDIKGLLSFYGTPLGKKVASTMSTASQESMQAGHEWAESMRPLLEAAIQSRLKREGIPADGLRFPQSPLHAR